MSVEQEPSSNATTARRKWLRWLIVAIVLTVVLGWPFPYLTSPNWEVLVENVTGQPAPGMYVVLSYQNYSVEDDSHQIIAQTDSNGRVVFGKQHGKASAAALIFYTLKEGALFVHGSFGRHAYVYAYGDRLEGNDVSNGVLVDWRGRPDSMQSVILVKPSR